MNYGNKTKKNSCKQKSYTPYVYSRTSSSKNGKVKIALYQLSALAEIVKRIISRFQSL